jgi:4-carboxymuconolactone decarboxylase
MRLLSTLVTVLLLELLSLRCEADEPRIGAPPLSQMGSLERQDYEATIKAFGQPAGPRLPLLNSPDLLAAWIGMQEALARSQLPARLKEVAILTVAAYWHSDFEWKVHEGVASKSGVSAASIAAIRAGNDPKFIQEDERLVYEYATELIKSHEVTDATYKAAWTVLGTRNLVDLTALLGHYSSVSMMLNAHKVPVPESVRFTPP